MLGRGLRLADVGTLRDISLVVALCSSTAVAIVVEIWLTLSITPAPRTFPLSFIFANMQSIPQRDFGNRDGFPAGRLSKAQSHPGSFV
jgi:hypothetical protein